MFSLIIVLVSIALVVALVAATIYYGGDSSKNAASKASAAALVNQATQIAAAGAVATSQGGAWPATAIGPQFSQPYLQNMPVPPKSAYAPGVSTPSAADWTYYLPDAGAPAIKSHHFVLKDKISKDVCLAVNRQVGFSGIPAAWDGSSIVQCFGVGPNYTFFFDPPGTSSGERQAAIDKSVADGTALLAAAPVGSMSSDVDGAAAGPMLSAAAPGYPRLCSSGRVIATGSCTATGGVGSGGGGSTAAFDCTGTYSPTALTASCVIKNNYATPMIVQQVRAYVDYTYLAAAPSACIGTLAAGAECSFTMNADFEGHPAGSGPALFLSYSVGPGGTGSNVEVIRNNFTPSAGGGAPVNPPGGAAFVSDSFTGTDGTLIMAHAPEIGGNWIRPYEINYGYNDCNWHLLGGKLAPNDYPCWGDDQMLLNDATPPSADYEVSVDFTLYDNYGYIEVYVLGRASLTDFMMGYLYIDGNGNSYAQISAYSEGNTGYVDVPLGLAIGTHTVKLSMVGSDFKLYYDGSLIHQRTTSAITTAGLAGFSMHHYGDLDYLYFDNFLAK